MQIRRFEEKDAHRCVEIMHANFDLFRESSGGHIPDAIVQERLKPAYNPEKLRKLAEKRVYWVATHRRKVIGLIGLEERGREGEIFNNYVDPEMQGRGTGTKLLRALIDHARRSGLKKLSVKDVLRTPLHDMHVRLGFEHVPERDKYLEDVTPPAGFNEQHACEHIRRYLARGGKPRGKIDQYHFELEL